MTEDAAIKAWASLIAAMALHVQAARSTERMTTTTMLLRTSHDLATEGSSTPVRTGIFGSGRVYLRPARAGGPEVLVFSLMVYSLRTFTFDARAQLRCTAVLFECTSY